MQHFWAKRSVANGRFCWQCPGCTTKHLSSRKNNTSTWSFVFSVFNRRLSHVVALVCDSTITIRAFPRLVGPVLIGCCSHRFNLPVQEYMRDQEFVNENIQVLMRKPSCSILSAHLLKATALKLIVVNLKHWGSTFRMLQHYMYLKKHVSNICDHSLEALLL